MYQGQSSGCFLFNSVTGLNISCSDSNAFDTPNLFLTVRSALREILSAVLQSLISSITRCENWCGFVPTKQSIPSDNPIPSTAMGVATIGKPWIIASATCFLFKQMKSDYWSGSLYVCMNYTHVYVWRFGTYLPFDPSTTEQRGNHDPWGSQEALKLHR